MTEGVFTITVTVDGTELSDALSITVDSHGPVLGFTSPERGHWTTDTTIDINASAADAWRLFGEGFGDWDRARPPWRQVHGVGL